ncbi:MAG: hypothetical protein HRT57_06615 [Crocinitomicaceae bacterium]|nr:hypothetical protein [Crocinitomicaceae bacterium]
MTQVTEQGKTRAIIAHITFIGWIIAFVMNNNKPKDEFASFYLRQMLGVVLLGVVAGVISGMLMFVPFIGTLIPLVVLVPWIMSFISAVNGEMKPLPIVGDSFQEWFKGI